MNYFLRYFFAISLLTFVVSCNKEVDESINDKVAVLFDAKTRVSESNIGDLIGVSLVDEYRSLYFGQYKIDETGRLRPFDGDGDGEDEEFFVRRNVYTVMYSGVDNEDGTATEVQQPETKIYPGCSVYPVHRTGKDEEGKQDIYIGVPDVECLFFSGNSLQYDNSNMYYAYYIFDAGIQLKQQYSKMKFSLESDKNNNTDNASGHFITDVGVTRLIDKAYICPVHGMHYNPETDIDNRNIRLTYDTPNSEGKVYVTEQKYLTGGDSGDGYVNIMSGDYSKIDPVSKKPVLTSPYLYVTYSGNPALTNYLPIMADLKPQTMYKLNATLTNLQINVVIYEIEEWKDGVSDDDGNGVVTQIANYSVKVNAPTDWEGNKDIEGFI